MFPEPEQVLRLEPEEIAWVILEIVQSWDASRIHQHLNHHNFQDAETKPYTKLKSEVADVLCEGWAWLKRECLFVPRPGSWRACATGSCAFNRSIGPALVPKRLRAMLSRRLVHPVGIRPASIPVDSAFGFATASPSRCPALQRAS